MFDSLPGDAATMIDWSWNQLAPYYDDLADRDPDHGNVELFLKDWTRLSELVDEIHSRLHVATTVNTADKNAEERYHRYLDEIYPASEEADQRIKKKFLQTGLEPDGFDVPLLRMRTETEIFREENLPLEAKEQKLCIEYSKIMGAQTVQWQGRELTISQLRPVFQDPNRDLRQKAWRLARGRQMEDRDAVNELWKELLSLRSIMASNAGFADYRSYRWKQLKRFDYTPDDCKSFHAAIEEVVVPAAGRIYESRQKRLKLDSLRPWDMDVDPLGRPRLEPFENVAELKSKTSAIFHRVDPRLGSFFDTMVSENLLDLDNRKNKAPGGYCTDFAAARRPFIFMNAVGMHDDVQTLLHESGHCFHTFEKNHLPYYQQRHVGMEFSEVASMSMELLAGRFLTTADGGFYGKDDAARAVVEHLEHSILFWPYMALVDAFQHWVYEHPEDSSDPAMCDEQWLFLSRRFMPGVDWSGLEQERMSIWQRQLHILEVPFYYVEYGLAQLGAVQIWSNSLTDPTGAIADYLKALSLGGTVSLPDLFGAAGARLAFDAETLRSAVGLMEDTLVELAG
jgi:oligoendopeptidase F